MRLLLPLVLLTLVLTGCKSRSVVGTWQGSLRTPRYSAERVSASDNAYARANVLIIRKNKTFAETGGEYSVEGKWTMKDNLLTLHPETVAGRPVQEVKEEIIAEAKGKKEEEDMVYFAEQIAANQVYHLTPDGTRLVLLSSDTDVKFEYVKQ